MKDKRVYIILAVLFITTLSLTTIFTKKIYINKIKPVNAKIVKYQKLEEKERKIEEKIKKEKKKGEKLSKKIKEKENEKSNIEKRYNKLISNLNGKIIYLTFDDGPSIYTKDILDTLDKYNVKATFFVTCSSYLEEYSKEIVKRGHTIALHTCTHEYSYVYLNENNYFKDLNDISNLVEKYTGIKSKYIRFPGGSSNTVSMYYNKGIMSRLTKQVNQKGYKYFDWNVDSNDAGGANKEQEYQNVIRSLTNSDRDLNMVLMHDTKISTRDSLEGIIKEALNRGYIFSSINDFTKEIHHGVNN